MRNYVRYDEQTKNRILQLRSEGMKYQQIAENLGIGWGVVQQTCSANDLGGSSVWSEKKRSQMREYKAQGHTAQEVADKYGVSVGNASKACRGIAPQSRTKEKSIQALKQYNAEHWGSSDERAKAFLARFAPNYEYVSDYTGNKGHIVARCRKCGNVTRLSCNNIRHTANVTCGNCLHLEIEERNRIIEQEREQERQERERIRNERDAEAERKRQERLHDCPVCGTRTDRQKYCSAECAKKASNARHEAQRRIKIEANMVDKDITLSSLFKRDGGVCHICGDQCRWDDYTVVNTHKIAGDWYPSIDHVVPLSKGGQHSWGNVKLAHRWCNTAKRDIPLSIFLNG